MKSRANEYWAKTVRDAFERAKASGTDLAFFGANAAYWQIRYEEDYRTIVGYKSASSDPETDPQLETDLFRALVPPRYECALMGIQHQGGILDWPTVGDYTVAATGDPWLEAAGLVFGDVVKSVVSREVDTIPGWLTPEDWCGNRLTVLFHRELGGDTTGDADAVRFTAPSGAKVFASGSHQFAWGLEDVPELREWVPEGVVDPPRPAAVRGGDARRHARGLSTDAARGREAPRPMSRMPSWRSSVGTLCGRMHMRLSMAVMAVTAVALAAGLGVSLGATVSTAKRPLCFGAPATIVGTTKSDFLRGTSERDVIVARKGADRCTVAAGTICCAAALATTSSTAVPGATGSTVGLGATSVSASPGRSDASRPASPPRHTNPQSGAGTDDRSRHASTTSASLSRTSTGARYS